MTSTIIRPNDFPILRAFLRRESRMFRWHPDGGEKRRQAYVRKLFKMITTWKLDDYKKFDYIHIQSLTNMGLLDSELVLTCQAWDTGDSLYLYISPTPHGGIGFSVKKGK